MWWKGEALYAQGRHEDALRFADHAYSLTNQLSLPNMSRLALTLKAKVHLARKQFDLAYESLVSAIETIEHMRVNAGGTEQQRALFFEGKLEPYHLMVELLIARQNFGQALLYAEQAKGRILLDVMQTGKASVDSVISVEERERDRRLNADIVSLNIQLYSEKLRSQPDKTRIAALNSSLDKARLDYETFRDGLYVVHRDLMRGNREAHFTIDELGALLQDSQTTFLEFIVKDDKTHLLVVFLNPQNSGEDRTQVEIKAFPIGVSKAELRLLVEEFRERLANPHLAARHVGTRLYELLLGPAATALVGKKSLIIVPDGPLWDLPFQALRRPDGRYLIEDYAISYSPSLKALHEVMIKKIGRTAGVNSPGVNLGSNIRQVHRSDLLAFGNPSLHRHVGHTATPIRRHEKLLPLPEAQREVNSLRNLYGTYRSKVYIGPAANEQKAKEEMGHYRVLHFAAHGILDGANPMYSHIVLADSEGSNEDGLLEAWEIMRLDLDAELAVLSACETARGRIGAGEGVIGMSWAFFVAGCLTTVASQWKVDSASTSELMIEFHRNLTIRSVPSKAEALRQAALKLLRSKRYNHPFYWAGFILMGDGR